MERRKPKDFISDLPDCLLHDILSFLDMTLVVRISILSKRWMYLCKSLPFMKFNQEVYNQYMDAIGAERSIVDFIEFVGKVLDLYINGSQLQTFTLCGLNNGRSIVSLKLPTFLYRSKTLTTLKLDMGDKGRAIFELPDSVRLPSLKTMYLRNLCIGNLGSFISSCPVLETLCIGSCLLGESKDLNISSHQLRNLEIYSLSSAGVHPSPFFTLCAPNLEVFSWYGFHRLATLHIPSLVSGEIMFIDHWDFRTRGGNPWKKHETQNVLNCLPSFSNAQDLCMTDLLVELQDCQCFDETKVKFRDGEEGNCEVNLQPECLSSRLIFVHVTGSLWNIYELELVKFLLMNATVLEKMTVSTYRKVRCYEYKKKIEAFPRASPSVQLTFF